MSNPLRFATVAAFAACVAIGGGCKSYKDRMEDAGEELREAKKEAAEGNIQAAREEIREAREDVKAAAKELGDDEDAAARSTYVDRVEADLAKLDRELEALHASTLAAGAEIRGELREARNHLRDRIDRFKLERWEETRGDVEAAMRAIDRELGDLRREIDSDLRALEKKAPGEAPPHS